jgi:hypothetical protein
MEMVQAYPLTWAAMYPRTPRAQRESARFEVSFSTARDELLNELRLLGATNVIISSNVPLRRDGLPYANFREPEDPGVAVYFKWRQKPYVMRCDRWQAWLFLLIL